MTLHLLNRINEMNDEMFECQHCNEMIDQTDTVDCPYLEMEICEECAILTEEDYGDK